MIHKKHLLAIVLPTIALMVVMPSIPAFAATKVFTTHQRNVPFSFDVGSICGSNDNIFTGKASIDITLWDNNKVDIHLVQHGFLIDSTTGVKVGESSMDEHSNLQPTGLPFTFQLNVQATCHGSGANPLVTLHEGITIDKNVVAHLHHS